MYNISSVHAPLVPPAHDPQLGYPPPQQSGYSHQEGYLPYPPEQAYPPPTQGYVPPPPPRAAEGYTPVSADHQQTNVVVVGASAPQQTTLIREEKAKVNHILHLLITVFLFPPWVFVWIILCAIYGV